MVLVLDGFLDAGNAAAHAARHLADLETGRTARAGSWRPSTSTSSTTTAPVAPRCRSSATTTRATTRRGWWSACCTTAAARRTSCCTDPEPDNRWEAFARAVREVVERLGVTRVVVDGLGADGGAAHPSDRDHPARQPPRAGPGRQPWRGELRIPSSAQSLLEVRLGEWGHDMLGFVAHIPHYLAQLDYPKAAAVLLEQVELAGRLTIDLTELHELARGARDRDRALPVLQRGGGRGGRRRWSSSTTPSSGPRSRGRACSPTTSRCRPARRSAGSSSSSWPASTPRTARPRRDRARR